MEELGFQVRTFDLLSGWDFTKPSHQREFIHLYYHSSPEIIWIAPPCTKWSPLQRLNARTPADKQRLDAQQQHEEGTHLRFSKTIHNKQYKQHRLSIFEHPRNATSWNTPTLQQLEGFDAHVDQCQYGATLPDSYGNKQYIKKPTNLRVTDTALASMLERVCADNRYHLPIEGSSPSIGSRAAAAGSYNSDMCSEWAQIMYDYMHNYYWPTPTEEAFPAEHDVLQPEGQALVPQQAAAEQPQPPVYDDEEQLDNNRGILTRLQETQWSAAQRTVQRIHRNLGHPTNLELARLLKSKNASPAIIAAAQEHRCQLCEAH